MRKNFWGYNMNYNRLKWACYTSNISMSAVACLSPVLFMTFRELYGISYSLLGLLVLINFLTQLGIDLMLSFFPHKFNIEKTVKFIPVLTSIGMLIYALWPMLFKDSAYIGLLIGTIIFSAAGGFNEVLISPVIAAIPSENPDREMSKLHSIYAWGVVGVVGVSTLFLKVFGNHNWQYLALLFVLVPLSSIVLFCTSQVPQLPTLESASGAARLLKNPTLWFCVMAIFFGGAAEQVMQQWSSSYLEQALGIPKIWGDLLGMALFAAFLGLGRSLYAKRGKNIGRVLIMGATGATACYIIAAVTSSAVIGLLACAFTGFCVSMLWPGSLIVSSERITEGGVFIFAMMASGGDLGAALGPQLSGLVTDAVIASPVLSDLSAVWSITPETLGMKAGMLIGALFSLAAIPMTMIISRKKSEK